MEELFKFYGKDASPFNDSFCFLFRLPVTWLSTWGPTCSFPNRISFIIDLNDLYATCWNVNLIRSGHV